MSDGLKLVQATVSKIDNFEFRLWWLLASVTSGRLKVDDFSKLPHLKRIGNAHRDAGLLKGFDQWTFVATRGFAYDEGLAEQIDLFDDRLDKGHTITLICRVGTPRGVSICIAA